jgi:hypothetical protein
MMQKGKKEGENIKDHNKYIKNPCRQIESDLISDEFGEEKTFTL